MRTIRVVRRGLLGLAGVGLIATACARSTPPDTPSVLLAEGRTGAQAWRLDGRRVAGAPCATLSLEGSPGPALERCGTRRTALRHLEPSLVAVGERLLVFSPVPATARRVRLDGADGSIRVEPARTAPGYPARFFVLDVDRQGSPLEVRTFADGGRAVVT